MTPRNHPQNGEIRYALAECSLGLALVAESDRGLCAILLGEDPEVLRRDLERRFRSTSRRETSLAILPRVLQSIESPGGGRPDIPLDLRGTDFQRRVWQALLDIPSGETASYTQVAERVDRPDAVRAVAQAIGANPVAVIVPCHRAIRRDGGLAGYHWGVDRKRALLAREAAP